MPLATLAVALTLVAGPADPPARVSERSTVPSLARVDFQSRVGAWKSALVIKSLSGGWTLRFNEDRCAQRFAPCSTFKIFNALAGLETGVLKDADVEFKWDGSKQRIKAWEKDHTLATALRDSVLWYFQKVATGVGAKRMQEFLDKCDYGTRDLSGGIDKFWLDSTLTISPDEQVRFMERLVAGRVPFEKENIDLVFKLIEQERGRDWVFLGKTGSAGDANGNLNMGWFVGRLKCGSQDYVFAMHLQGDGAWGRKAKEISLQLLRDLGLVPKE